MEESNSSDRLYIDDLNIGQRFTSATHAIDERRNAHSSTAWQRAAGTPPRSRCVSMLRAARRLPAALSGLA